VRVPCRSGRSRRHRIARSTNGQNPRCAPSDDHLGRVVRGQLLVQHRVDITQGAQPGREPTMLDRHGQCGGILVRGRRGPALFGADLLHHIDVAELFLDGIVGLHRRISEAKMSAMGARVPSGWHTGPKEQHRTTKLPPTLPPIQSDLSTNAVDKP
jgi:hypothetical protein